MNLSAPCASAFTVEVRSDRFLRQSRMIDLSHRAARIVTGNNPRVSLEIAPRRLRGRLDTKTTSTLRLAHLADPANGA